MNASETRDETLKRLRRARTEMMSARWMLALEREDASTRKEAARELLRTQHAIRKLENAQLAEIRDRLLANESALEKGREELDQALDELNDVKKVIRSVGNLLGVVGRAIKLIV
jgi:chromosome segregation ATPase